MGSFFEFIILYVLRVNYIIKVLRKSGMYSSLDVQIYTVAQVSRFNVILFLTHACRRNTFEHFIDNFNKMAAVYG